MTISTYNASLFDYLEASPTPFHAIEQLEKKFTANGFIKLQENESWTLEKVNHITFAGNKVPWLPSL